jgi:hypothetical protein
VTLAFVARRLGDELSALMFAAGLGRRRGPRRSDLYAGTRSVIGGVETYFSKRKE